MTADPTPPMSAEEMRAEIKRHNEVAGHAAAAGAIWTAGYHAARASDLARRLEQQEKKNG